MRIRASWGLTVLLAASALIGCGQSRPMVRGQSPTGAEPAPAVSAGVEVHDQGPIIGSAPGYGEYVKSKKSGHVKGDFKVYDGFRDNNFGYEGGYYAGPDGYYTDHDRIYKMGHGGAGCPACEYGNGCPHGGCQHCGCKGKPKHYQTYRFDWPQNMVYPPDVVPAGMVVYPYYNCKGPSDFFMK